MPPAGQRVECRPIRHDAGLEQPANVTECNAHNKTPAQTPTGDFIWPFGLRKGNVNIMPTFHSIFHAHLQHNTVMRPGGQAPLFTNQLKKNGEELSMAKEFRRMS